VAAAVFLQLVPLLFCVFVLPAFAWGLGYWYLGRTRRFVGALLAAPLLLFVVPFLVYLSLDAATSCQGSAYPGECAGWADLAARVLAGACALVVLVLAAIAMAVDAAVLARATNRERSQAARPAPYSAPRSARTPIERRCVAEAAGLQPAAADAAFWRSVRADWLTGDPAAEPFADAAMNAVYAELLALRQEQPPGAASSASRVAARSLQDVYRAQRHQGDLSDR
jgi:hypothetical protein